MTFKQRNTQKVGSMAQFSKRHRFKLDLQAGMVGQCNNSVTNTRLLGLVIDADFVDHPMDVDRP